MSSQKPADRNKEEAGTSRVLEDNFVRYDPESPAYEKLHLCKYLSELPDLEEKDDPGTD